ncbi:hypothetical protein [Luteibacter sp. OK325]|uniref:hypothetical protein n=1 Tax=Luteibacter sp. OK325 TaxID=2135670 RepID=UPI000D3C1A27|nr:hypothetical protein [Luteibacter sp. OK325]
MGVNLNGISISARRVAAIVVTVGCHVGLLMVLLRPASNMVDTTAIADDKTPSLELRFISTPLKKSPMPTSQTPQLAGSRDAPANESARSRARRTRAVITRSEANSPNAPITAEAPTQPVVPTASTSPGTSDPPMTAPTSTGDGGFRERLGNAQHSQGVRGVPGSDAPVVTGIQLTDPMNQGVGAVMRSTQRLFGITDRHCIDVEVWQSLTPEELSARHLSPGDVRTEQEKYNCNRPLGLSF